MNYQSVLVISDTHGDLRELEQIVQREQFDIVFHLGDTQGDDDRIRTICKTPVEIVRGNCDLFSTAVIDRQLTLHGREVLLTHGHKYGVKSGRSQLLQEAKKRKVEIVFYGHTHVPGVWQEDGITIANPGSLSYPRGGYATYLMLRVQEDASFKLVIREVGGQKNAM